MAANFEQENALELTVRLGCPVLCGFCPQKLLVRRSRGTVKRVLTRDDLETILTNATSRSPLRVIFAGFAEPFSVRHTTQLLQVCEDHARVHRITVYTTGEGVTVGDLEFMASLRKLHRDDAETGNRYVNFHVRPRSDYSLMKGAKGGVWDLLPHIARLLPASRFVCVTEGVCEDALEAMRREISGHGLAFTTRDMESRAGNVTSVDGRRVTSDLHDRPLTCCKVRPGSLMPVVLPDGATFACCNDYARELPVGNLLSDTWESLDFSWVAARQGDPGSGLPCFRDCHIAEPVSPARQGAAGASSVWE